MESTALLKHTELAESVHPQNVPIKHVVKPGSSVAQFRHKFDTMSASSATVNWKPPGGANSLISRQMFIEYKFTVELDAAANQQLTCLRSHPLNNVITNCTVKINGQGSVSSRPRDCVRIMERMHDDAQFRARYKSLYPSQLDWSNHYDSMVPFRGLEVRGTAAQALVEAGGAVAGSFYKMYTPNSPFVAQNFSSSTDEATRKAFPSRVTNQPAAAANGLTYTVVEPLMHPLFMVGADEALANVRELTIEMTFSDLRRAVSAFEDITLAGRNIEFLENSFYLVGYFEMPSIPIPPTVKIGLPMHEVRVENIGAVSSALVGGVSAEAPFTSQTHYLNQVPSKLYFACPVSTTQTVGANTQDRLSSCCGLNIKKFELTLNGQSGYLSLLDDVGLYQMSAMNGLTSLNYPQFAKSGMSIIVVDFAKDIGRFQPGALGNFSVQIKATYASNVRSGINANITVADFDFSAVAIFEYDAELTLSASDVNTQSGVTQSELASAEGAADQGVIALNDSNFTGSGMHGGKFNVGSFFRGLRQGVHTAANVANRGNQAAAMLGIQAPPRVQAALAGLNVVDQASRGFGGSSLTYG